MQNSKDSLKACFENVNIAKSLSQVLIKQKFQNKIVNIFLPWPHKILHMFWVLKRTASVIETVLEYSQHIRKENYFCYIILLHT